MKQIKNSRVLGLSLVLLATSTIVAYATDPGSMAAIAGASKQCRNIIGIEISNATKEQRAAVQCKEKGVFVSSVIPTHPAATAGVKVGDIIIKINDQPVPNVSEALMAMNDLDAGQRYSFEVCRINDQGNPQNLTLRVLVEKVQEKTIAKIT